MGTDQAGGTPLTWTSEAACFGQGTRILTDRGEVAVEALAIGDGVVTAAGVMRSIIWIGHRRVDCARHPIPRDVHPVQVCTHAFAPGAPRRDLRLSPDHAVFVDGVLTPIKHLINGVAIVQEVSDSMTYWHVELARHAVILAEGLQYESYLDTGHRAAFANGVGVVQMHPDSAGCVWAAQ